MLESKLCRLEIFFEKKLKKLKKDLLSLVEKKHIKNTRILHLNQLSKSLALKKIQQ